MKELDHDLTVLDVHGCAPVGFLHVEDEGELAMFLTLSGGWNAGEADRVAAEQLAGYAEAIAIYTHSLPNTAEITVLASPVCDQDEEVSVRLAFSAEPPETHTLQRLVLLKLPAPLEVQVDDVLMVNHPDEATVLDEEQPALESLPMIVLPQARRAAPVARSHLADFLAKPRR